MQRYNPQRTVTSILCCKCGVLIEPNPGNVCGECFTEELGHSGEIPAMLVLHHCRNCERYHIPPKKWVYCEPESLDLLKLCMQRIKVKDAKITDGSFIWTESHSRRLQVRVLVDRDTETATVRQEATVEYVLQNLQCKDCERLMAEKTWCAIVQIRQRAEGRRTLLYLEQLILTQNAHRGATDFKMRRNGMDFYFSDKNAANRFVAFIECTLPVKKGRTEKLVSEDTHTGERFSKASYVLDIPPISKEDLICLPKSIAHQLGTSRFLLCLRVRKNIHLVDCETPRKVEVPGLQYWKTPFVALLSKSRLCSFVVRDIEDEWEAAVTKTVYVVPEENVDSQEIATRTSIPLCVGDCVLGYSLTHLNTQNDALEEMREDRVPDVVLVKKKPLGKKQDRRLWRLKRLQNGDEAGCQDTEMFMEEIEEDKELRSSVGIVPNEEVLELWERGEEVASSIPVSELMERFSSTMNIDG
ncbi:MAG: 60S ribosomal export protein NMD3 [Amphiamblys sp. WSBS2006]|nr:MAG: 60S ribosomal export protein NMD3 [Amphiamblys sp. WSBS2006]